MMAAPAALGYGGAAAVSDRIAGPLAASFAFVALWDVVRPLRWVDAPIGLWIAVSPLVLGYGGAAAVNAVVVGVVVIAMSFVRGTVKEEFGGGWRSLWSPGTHRESAGGQPTASQRGGRE
jgi:hypothetical protein